MRLHVFLTTAGRKDAQSDSKLELEFRGQKFPLADPALNDREQETTNYYLCDLGDIPTTQFESSNGRSFKLVAQGGDAWLPSSVFIIGEQNGSERLMVFLPVWNRNAWFSTQLSDAGGKAEKARLLDSNGTPVQPD